MPLLSFRHQGPVTRDVWWQLGLRFVYRWGCNIVALFLAALIFTGIDYGSFWTLVVAGFVFSIVNAVVRPVLILLGIVFVILTFGLGLLLINALMLWLTDLIVPGFEVSGFWTAVGGALIVWLANLALDVILRPEFRQGRQPQPPVDIV